MPASATSTQLGAVRARRRPAEGLQRPVYVHDGAHAGVGVDVDDDVRGDLDQEPADPDGRGHLRHAPRERHASQVDGHVADRGVVAGLDLRARRGLPHPLADAPCQRDARHGDDREGGSDGDDHEAQRAEHHHRERPGRSSGARPRAAGRRSRAPRGRRTHVAPIPAPSRGPPRSGAMNSTPMSTAAASSSAVSHQECCDAVCVPRLRSPTGSAAAGTSAHIAR